MAKRIQVTLTEDQAYHVIALEQSFQDKLDKESYAEEAKAFSKRIEVKLAQALVIEQAKN